MPTGLAAGGNEIDVYKRQGVHWSGRINGKFKCIMEPYPGNELDL